jgi:hypothetical protein
MINMLFLIVGIFLLIVSVIDWKLKCVPSIFLTAMLFAVAVLNPANLWFGIMAFIVAYLLMEADFFSGVADIKVMTILGFMIHTTNGLFALMLLTVIYGFLWKVMIKWRFKKAMDVAFLPVFLFIYITMLLLGWII